jgi:hypothetical protein
MKHKFDSVYWGEGESIIVIDDQQCGMTVDTRDVPIIIQALERILPSYDEMLTTRILKTLERP